ncbi:MAG: 2-oxo acid dehydrogenase subunit E2 [Pseudomonadota bacterium]
MNTVMLAPKINANDESMLISEWLVDENEYIKSGQEIVRIETSKVDITLTSDYSGYICRHGIKGDYVNVNEKLASFSDTPNKDSNKQDCDSTLKPTDSYQLSKAAREFIIENKLNISEYNIKGLITLKDLQELIADKNKNNSINSLFPAHTEEDISSAKKQEINVLERSYHQALTSSVTVQFESAKLRENLKKIPWLNNQILPYILYVLARVCVNYPKLTAYYLENKIFYYNRVNLGLAIDLNKGLKVAVIHNANVHSLYDMHINIIDHISNYYDNKLNLDAVHSSTMTVTDLSSNNILVFQPLLNDKQSAILGIGGDSEMNGYPMTLTLVFDHRVLTGREAAEFIVKLKNEILHQHFLISEAVTQEE